MFCLSFYLYQSLSPHGSFWKIQMEPCNSITTTTTKPQITWLKYGQRTWIDISSEKTNKLATSIWKHVWHYPSSEKRKLKLKWKIILQLLGWLLSKHQQKKTVWQTLRKIKHGTTMWLSNPTTGYVSKGSEISISKRCLHSSVCGSLSIVHSSQDRGTTQVSVKGRMEKKMWDR